MWEAEEKSPKLPAVTTWLPVPSEYGDAPLVNLATGDPMPERPPDWLAPPIAWLAAEQEHGQLWLSAPDGVDEEGLILIAPDGTTACERVGAGLRWQWPSGEPPRQAQVRWGCEPSQTALVPVQDQFGRMAAEPLAVLTLDEARQQLAAFPSLGVEDDADAAADGEEGGEGETTGTGSRPTPYAG